MPDASLQIDRLLLAKGKVPSSSMLSSRELVFLWQTPHLAALRSVCRKHPAATIVAGRFGAETVVAEAGLDYLCPSDFIPHESLIQLEIETFDRRVAMELGPMPRYRGMPLLDGDLNRARIWFEMVACVWTLALIRQATPDVRVITDWMGARLAGAIGMAAESSWSLNMRDPQWPRRRTMDTVHSWIGSRWHHQENARPANPAGESIPDCDVLVMLGGWVEGRFLEGFPLRPLTDAGCRCLTLAHRRSEALERVLQESGSAFVQVDYPAPAADASRLAREVARWCDHATDAGWYWPFHGEAARRLDRLMRWPRWAAKLVAMHERMTAILEAARPRLVLAPAEKDWGPYCMMHAARRAGIPAVGIKHASWMVGSRFDRLEHGLYTPSAARHLLAYTPMDEQAARHDQDLADGLVIWRGNPRLDKRDVIRRRADRAARQADSEGEQKLTILVGARGIGGGRTLYLRRSVLPWNRRLMEALGAHLGEAVQVRLHPWDSPLNYPTDLRTRILTQDESLDDCLVRSDALVTTYSTVALDAAAAGIPVFLWDHMRMDLNRCEIVRCGSARASCDLDELCGEVVRFRDDAAWRIRFVAQARRFSEGLHADCGEAPCGTASLTRWLLGQMSPAGRPATPLKRGHHPAAATSADPACSSRC